MKHFNLAKAMAFALLGTCVFGINACKEDGGSDDPSDDLTPTITAVSPGSAEVGESITLSGTNFSATAADNTVSIGGTAATVASASTTSLSCTVPDIAVGAADITVTAGGLTSESYSGFTVAETIIPVEVTGFSPDSASYGDEVTITGSGFGTDNAVASVYINGVEQTISSIINTEIKINLTEKTFSGEVVVNRDNQTDTADATYNYVETYSTESFLNVGPVDAAWDSEGNMYLVENYYLVEYDAQNNLVDTLIKDRTKESAYGLFMSDDDILYITDWYSRLTYMPMDTKVLDTLVYTNNVYTSNDNQKGITGDNQGNIYYANGDNGQIFKVEISSGAVTEIYNDAIYSIYTVKYFNDKLYFIAAGENAIYSMDTDGSNITEVFSNSVGIWYYSFAQINGDLIYILTGDGLAKITGTDSYEKITDYDASEKIVFETADNDLIVSNGGNMISGYDYNNDIKIVVK